MPNLFDDDDPKLLAAVRDVVPSKITDQDVFAATSNGDGTHNGVKLAQWLYEATTGKALSDADAKALVEGAKTKARERLAKRDAEARS